MSVIDISDSDTDAPRESSVLVIDSSNSEAETVPCEINKILRRLDLNAERAPPVNDRAGHQVGVDLDSILVLSSSDDEAQPVLPTRLKTTKSHKSLGASSGKQASEIPLHSSAEPSEILPVMNPATPKTTLTRTTKDLEKVDPKLHRSVNKLVVDRKSTLKDFTLEVSYALQHLPFVALLTEKLAAYDGKLELFEPPEDVTRLIRFRRYHIARYDNRLKEWILIEPCAYLEDLYVIHLAADQLVRAVSEEALPTMFSALRKSHGLTPRSQIFLMIDGINGYWKRKKTKKAERDAVELNLTFLQASERCYIVHTDGPEDTSGWLFNITSDLGIRPYKRIQDSFLPFCTDTKVKCGTSKDDTYKKMLQQIHGITESAADGIVQEVPTLRQLFEGYEEESDAETRHDRLREVTIANRKDGVAKSRRLNQALSKKVHDVIWGEDPLTLVL